MATDINRKQTWMAVSAVLCALVLLLGITGAVFSRRARAAEEELRILQENAVLNAVSQLETLRRHIDKALLSRDENSCSQWLMRVSSGAAGVLQSITLLPVDFHGTEKAMKLANQMQDYAVMLEGGNDEGITQSQQQALKDLSTACQGMMEALHSARTAWAAEENGKNLSSQTLMDDTVAYPTLIYDGPFSDAQTPEHVYALQGLKEITREDALRIAREYLGAEALRIAPGTDVFGPIPCYGVTAERNGVVLQMAVTRQGGKVLWMFPDRGGFESLKTVEECRQLALKFLDEHGYMNMEPLQFEVYDGLAVLNFAASQGQTLLYPDQVKVQIRMDTGDVVGIECRGYLTYHRPRGALIPDITAEEAQGMVSEQLRLTEGGRLCVIPLNGSEILCWQFTGEYDGERYLIYINARSARQEEILKLVETEYGIQVV
ncbi:MAG: germination protein YpeB [Clostridia bacterium]|nr:germination protein YpeB [Clostridia bacterium]